MYCITRVIGRNFYANFRGTRQSAVKLTFVCYKVQTVDGTSNRAVYVVPSSACKVNVCVHQLKIA